MINNASLKKIFFVAVTISLFHNADCMNCSEAFTNLNTVLSNRGVVAECKGKDVTFCVGIGRGQGYIDQGCLVAMNGLISEYGECQFILDGVRFMQGVKVDRSISEHIIEMKNVAFPGEFYGKAGSDVTITGGSVKGIQGSFNSLKLDGCNAGTMSVDSIGSLSILNKFSCNAGSNVGKIEKNCVINGGDGGFNIRGLSINKCSDETKIDNVEGLFNVNTSGGKVIHVTNFNPSHGKMNVNDVKTFCLDGSFTYRSFEHLSVLKASTITLDAETMLQSGWVGSDSLTLPSWCYLPHTLAIRKLGWVTFHPYTPYSKTMRPRWNDTCLVKVLVVGEESMLHSEGSASKIVMGASNYTTVNPFEVQYAYFNDVMPSTSQLLKFSAVDRASDDTCKKIVVGSSKRAFPFDECKTRHLKGEEDVWRQTIIAMPDAEEGETTGFRRVEFLAKGRMEQDKMQVRDALKGNFSLAIPMLYIDAYDTNHGEDGSEFRNLK